MAETHERAVDSFSRPSRDPAHGHVLPWRSDLSSVLGRYPFGVRSFAALTATNYPGPAAASLRGRMAANANNPSRRARPRRQAPKPCLQYQDRRSLTSPRPTVHPEQILVSRCRRMPPLARQCRRPFSSRGQFPCSPPTSEAIQHGHKGSSHLLINTTGLNRMLRKRRYNTVMRSGQFMLWDAATQQCRSREIEHCVIRSVDRTVRVTILQLSSACQSALALSLEIAGQWAKRQRMIPSRATFRRKPGLGKRSGCSQWLFEIGTG